MATLVFFLKFLIPDNDETLVSINPVEAQYKILSSFFYVCSVLYEIH